MSLSVDVFLREPDGQWRVLDVPEGRDDSAGFESWRRTVWGSQPVRALGARFLPVLADDDLEVEAEDVAEFLREVALLRDHLDAIAESTRRPRGLAEHRAGLVRRLRNLEVAALHARVIGGGVLIW
ncbi:hypothetical protein G3I77_24265 [Streptomyces sp. D2-8]|uniref:hypothetical protein n=1 Tax=Streptomyces sp. D2-8 TaxID=2707767 RepID=UPI0020BEC5EA|nr:hypothetical protein [Streptomyces sp. D2-8]MCK8436017.1 hypothetical protein [Streptomyces sp. D2-8]